MAWIDTHYEESFSLDEMVARCALNASDFSRRFKALTGSPLFEYLNRRRVARAALLLKDGDLPVIEIAYSVGYNSLSFFNRYFLRLMGLTPTAFRRQNR
ncbi:MAG: AraC family transcriptional regulator [Spirochaetota bacterium]